MNIALAVGLFIVGLALVIYFAEKLAKALLVQPLDLAFLLSLSVSSLSASTRRIWLLG